MQRGGVSALQVRRVPIPPHSREFEARLFRGERCAVSQRSMAEKPRRPNLASNRVAPPPPGGAMHENFARIEEIEGPSDRRFGLTVAMMCVIIGVVRAILGHGHWVWWVAAGILFALVATAAPMLLAPLNRLWLKLGLLLYKFVNPMVMTLLFFTTIVPVGALMRLCGKDSLRLRRDPEAKTYWIDRQPSGPPVESMRRQF
jgi:hypothetical protein